MTMVGRSAAFEQHAFIVANYAAHVGVEFVFDLGQDKVESVFRREHDVHVTAV